MADIVKCKYCKNPIDKAIAYKVGERNYYCNKEHYDEKQRELHKDKGNKIKYKPQEGSSRREFTDKVQSIYINSGWSKEKINWAMICSNASNILNEHENWSYDTLTYILYYMYDILGLNLICAESNYSPLGLLPYYAIEAEEYFNQTSKIEENAKTFVFDDTCIIKNKSNRNNNKLYIPIDISEL